MKAVISNRIYLEAGEELKNSISKELTYTIQSFGEFNPPTVIKNMVRLRPKLITMPSGRTDLIPEDYEIVDKRVTVPLKFPKFKGELRESQKVVYDDLTDSCIINAWTSWGKTFTALAIASKLGQRTLVVTHTISLRNQWAREVEKVFGIKPGIIGSGKFNIDSPIVIGNTQTLYRNIDKVKDKFGTIILDEMHHVSSPTFAKIIDTSYARYKIGLSGTIQRKDGKHIVFQDYFGHKLYQPPKENYMVPEVHVVKSHIRFPDGANLPWANRVNTVAYNDEYIHSMSMIAAAYAVKGHKVLLVSDRVHFLTKCAEAIGPMAVCITGKIDDKERERLKKQVETDEDKRVICATQAIFSEGISINPLSCLILGTPVNNEPLLTQLIGRIIRKVPGKLKPVVIDTHLKGNTAVRQASNRMAYYMKEGYDIKEL